VQIGAALDDVAERLAEDAHLRTPARFFAMNVVASALHRDTNAVVRPGLKAL